MPITIPISLWNLVNYLWSFVNRSFSHDVTVAIFVYKTMNRRELNSFHMLKLFLFQAICKANDHVTEDDL